MPESTAEFRCLTISASTTETKAMNFRLRRGRKKRPVHKYRIRFKYVRTRT